MCASNCGTGDYYWTLCYACVAADISIDRSIISIDGHSSTGRIMAGRKYVIDMMMWAPLDDWFVKQSPDDVIDVGSKFRWALRRRLAFKKAPKTSNRCNLLTVG